MTRTLLWIVALSLMRNPPAFSTEANLPPYRRTDLSVKDRVEDLLARLTLDEKIDQLHQTGVGHTNPNNLSLHADEFRCTYGSFVLNGPTDLPLRNELQRRALEESRHGIPALFAADVIHGYRLIFPIPLAQACAWDSDLVTQSCATAAKMARAQGVDWTFAPMVDHCVDPRWGRVAETFGESPFASSAFCVASVNGYQTGPYGIASCLKHYVGYGSSEGGRDYSSTEISAQRLWEMHLPPFDAGVRAGARTVMSAFNDLNGVPTSANRFTLTDILRDRWHFNGVVVSDWNATLQLILQGYASDGADAAQKSLLAGVDVDMADGLYRKHLAQLIADGRVPLAAVDEAVRRMLRLKFELGLFEHPYPETPLPSDPHLTNAQLEQASEFAARSIVLLKNNGALPLARTVHHIALIGPLANDGAALLGSWALQGNPQETTTIEAGLRERLSPDTTLRTLTGCALEGADEAGFPAAVELAQQSDAVILCLGEAAWMSGENASRSSLRLPGVQEALALAVAATGRTVIVLLVSGRPLEIAFLESKVAAVMAVWQPGSCGGTAVADLILGYKNPSGRLAISWPRATGQIPIYHNSRPRARGGREGAYQDIDTTPLYDFGHGLSYSTFAYSSIRLARTTVAEGETLSAEVMVSNTSTRDGIETVLWFIRDPVASVTRPLKELKHFESALIPAGKSRTYRFEIEPTRDLSFPDENGKRILETGEIHLYAGVENANLTVVRR